MQHMQIRVMTVKQQMAYSARHYICIGGARCMKVSRNHTRKSMVELQHNL